MPEHNQIHDPRVLDAIKRVSKRYGISINTLTTILGQASTSGQNVLVDHFTHDGSIELLYPREFSFANVMFRLDLYGKRHIQKMRSCEIHFLHADRSVFGTKGKFIKLGTGKFTRAKLLNGIKTIETCLTSTNEGITHV